MMKAHPKFTLKHALAIGAILVFVMAGLYFNRRNISPSLIDQIKETNSERAIISGSFDESRFRSDEEWKNILTSEQFHILRKAGTEFPFTGELDKEDRPGTYYSVGCDIPLFRSEQKYDSGTGWPSFWAPIENAALVLRKEGDLDQRIEVLDRCGGHLGHVFDDGPEPTGKRYCMNSIALHFVPDTE